MYRGGEHLCGPTLSGSKMFSLDLNLVLEQLIIAGGVRNRGKTMAQLGNGERPVPITLGASADGGKLVEHQGFILMVLRITEHEILTNLGNFCYNYLYFTQ